MTLICLCISIFVAITACISQYCSSNKRSDIFKREANNCPQFTAMFVKYLAEKESALNSVNTSCQNPSEPHGPHIFIIIIIIVGCSLYLLTSTPTKLNNLTEKYDSQCAWSGVHYNFKMIFTICVSLDCSSVLFPGVGILLFNLKWRYSVYRPRAGLTCLI